MVNCSWLRLLSLLLLVVASLVFSGCAGDAAYRTSGAPEFYDEGPPGPEPSSDDDDDVGSDDDDDETDDDDQGASGVHVVSTVPAPGSDSHLYRAPIRLEFSGYAASVGVSLYDDEGYSVPAQLLWWDDMSSCELWPVAPLTPDSDYEVVIAIGDAAIEFEFRTSTVGLAVLPSDVTGRVFALDFSLAESPSSPTLGGLLRASSSSATWLISPSALEGGEIDFEMAFALAGPSGFEQSTCSSTSILGDGTDGSPGTLEPGGSYFLASGEGLVLALDDRSLVFDIWALSGDFSAEADELVAVDFAGEMVATSLGLASEAEACDLAETELDSFCLPCLSDPMQSCIPVGVSGISGLQTSEDIVPPVGVAEDDCQDELSGLLSCSFTSSAVSPNSFVAFALLLLAGFIRRR